ncbi:MAG: hypothetical protein ACJAS9_000101 [Polaribacter sp.]|jgi:hypothetical protein
MHSSLIQIYHICFALIVCILMSKIGLAKEISNIYRVDIQVKEQSNKARWQASLEGFKQVLVRRSGSNRILSSKQTIDAYKKVTSYVQKSQYSSNTELMSEYKYIISLHFEPRLIDNLIKRANQPLWDSNRPVSMLWLSQEETVENNPPYRRIIIENVSEQVTNNLILKNSNRRGVPVILPLMDFDDNLLVTQSDVWGRFPEAIIVASKRYLVESIIIGKIYQRDGLWIGQLSYFNESNNLSFEHQTDNVEMMYEKIFDSLAEILCNQYCVTQTATVGQELLIEIENITNFEAFLKIKNYIFELSAIRQVDVLAIHQDKLVLKLSLLSNEQAVIDSLSLNRQLRIVVKEEVSVIDDNKSLDEYEDPLMSFNDDNQVETAYIVEPVILEPTTIKPVTHEVEIKTIFYRWAD